MLLVILVVMFTLVMFLWLLAMLGAIPNSPSYSPWLGWFSCLILGIAVFLTTSGIVVYRP